MRVANTKRAGLPLSRRPGGGCEVPCRRAGAGIGNSPSRLDWSSARISASPVGRMGRPLRHLSARWCRAQALSRPRSADRRIRSRTFQATNATAPSNVDESFQSPRTRGPWGHSLQRQEDWSGRPSPNRGGREATLVQALVPSGGMNCHPAFPVGPGPSLLSRLALVGKASGCAR